MGILNVTPDSFWDGGRHGTLRKAVARGLELQEQGADILDIGAESTRPGSKPVSLQTERQRLLPLLEKLLPSLRIPVSIDTAKAAMAEEALRLGARMINDTGALSDPGMAEAIARHRAWVILMHRKGSSAIMQKNPRYTRGVLGEIRFFFRKRVSAAKRAGIAPQRIVLDPGIGFGKTLTQNLSILQNIEKFRALGYPIAIGLSRKSFLGALLGALPEKRLAGSLAAGMFCLLRGATILRVHDVEETAHARKVLEALHAFHV